MKKILVVALIVVSVIVLIGVTKDLALGSIVSFASSNILGAPVKIGGLSVGIFKQSVHIKDLKVYQPKGFPSGVLIDIPTILVDYDLKALLGGKLHFPYIEVDLKELNVIKNKDRQLNVEALKVSQKKEEAAAAPSKEKKPAKMLAMQIDTLKLNAGKVIYTDYAAAEKPVVQVYEGTLKNKTYQNITSAEQLAGLLLSESLKGTAIQGAKIYAANLILGAGFLPAGVAVTLAGSDSGTLDVDQSFDQTYRATLETLKGMGEIKTENKAQGIIKAVVSKADVTARISQSTEKTTRIVVSAREMLLPKPEIAKGVVLKLSEKLK